MQGRALRAKSRAGPAPTGGFGGNMCRAHNRSRLCAAVRATEVSGVGDYPFFPGVNTTLASLVSTRKVKVSRKYSSTLVALWLA